MTLLDLLARDTQLRSVGMNHKRHSIEYAGPCPFCGGTDRFHVWPEAERPHYWCRQCKASGDAIEYLRMHDKMRFYQACRYLGIKPSGYTSSTQLISCLPLDLDPPGEVWQQRANKFCQIAAERLWSEQGSGMRAYLHSRGLHDESIHRAGLGYHPTERKELATTWGIEADGPVWLPAGLVIPGVVSGVFWRVNIRTGQAQRPYVAVAGSLSLLYQADLLSEEKPAMLLESDLDALQVHQEAGDLISPVATEGTNGARHLYWIGHLATPRFVMVSYDADEAGDQAGEWWQAHLPHTWRWRPLVKDPGEMHRLSISVREWVEDALLTQGASLTQPALPMPAVISTTSPSLKELADSPAPQRISIDQNKRPHLTAVKLLPWQIMLNCLPQRWRQEELAVEAAKAYCKAGEPKVSVLLWRGCIVPDQLRGVTLWKILGDALAADATTSARAREVLGRLAINGGGEQPRNRS